MDSKLASWRPVAIVGLGALACLLLPLNGLVPTIHSRAPLAFGSLVAGSLIVGCVVGLLGGMMRPRWLVAGLSALAALIAFVALGALDRAYFDAAGFAVGIAVAACAASGLATVAATGRRRLAETIAVAAVLLVALWFAGLLPGPLAGAPAHYRHAALARAPQPEHYTFDGQLFLRTYLLMKGGESYYPAFTQAVIDDSRHDSAFLTSPFNYREPLVFEVWRVLPGSNGNDLFLWFVAWSLATMIAAYYLASRLAEPGAALLAPIALTTFFFYFWWAGLWFAIIEVWAAGLAVLAVAMLVRRQRVGSLAALIAAVAGREFMVVLIPAWLLAWWFWSPGGRRASWWLPTLAVAGPLAVLAVHLASVPKLASGGAGLGAWLQGGPVRELDALRFGWNASVGFAWIPLVIAVLAIVAAALARPRWRMAALLSATILPTLFLLVFSGGAPWRYWGAFYTPLAVAIAPGVLGRLMASRGASEEAEGA